MILDTFIYYVLFASSVLVYGVGMNRIANVGFEKNNSLFFYIKMIINVFACSVLGWLVTNYVLLPIGIIELFPLVVFLIFISISSFIEAIVRITTNTTAAEFVLSFLIVLLSILESTSLINTILICFCCLIEMLLLVPFIIAFKNRVIPNGKNISERYYGLFFIFLAVLVLVLTVWDVVWIKPGALL